MPDAWTHLNTISSSFLHVSEGRTEASRLEGEYDLLIFLGTWESRGAAIATVSKIKAKRALIPFFSPSHAPPEIIAATISNIAAALADRVGDIEPLQLNRSVNFHESLNILNRRVTEICRQFPQPRIGIDISSIPIGYIQGLIGYMISASLSAYIDCFYIEPHYGDQGASDGPSKFTSGNWQLCPVPYLEGKSMGSPDKFVFVCIGAENGNTRELLLGREYSQAAIVKPSNGRLSSWSDQIDRDCDELISSVNVIGDSYLSAHAFSIVEVARYYSDVVGPAWHGSQRMFVAIGTKPHGLAGVVCGFADPSLAIFARVPNGYLVRDVTAGSHCWRYRLRDLSSPIWAVKDYADWC